VRSASVIDESAHHIPSHTNNEDVITFRFDLGGGEQPVVRHDVGSILRGHPQSNCPTERIRTGPQRLCSGGADNRDLCFGSRFIWREISAEADRFLPCREEVRRS
jgi:hypothetical protein